MTWRGWFVGIVLVALAAGLPAPAYAAGVTFTVTSTADSGTGTLRQAILDANGDGNPSAVDTIAFDIRTGNGPFTIQGVTDFPQITEPVTIDGYTQGVGTPGTPADDARPNSQSVGTNAVLKIVLTRSSVGSNGLDVNATRVTIRGLVFSGITGIEVDEGGSAKIVGNFIGTDATGYNGTGGFDGTGVAVLCPSGPVTIGGPSLSDRNLISGNGVGGIVAVGPSPCRRLVVENNLIGASPDANARTGVQNLIGIIIGSQHAGRSSVLVRDNLIAHNGQAGLEVILAQHGVRILHNSIDRNGIGIDLNDDGVTPNDASDADNGANRLQNFPVITSISRTDPHHVVHGVLRSRPNRKYLIQFFEEIAPNPSGFGEGASFLGQLSVLTDGHGRAAFSKAFNVGIDEWVTATATDSRFGDTSEFSKAVQVP